MSLSVRQRLLPTLIAVALGSMAHAARPGPLYADNGLVAYGGSGSIAYSGGGLGVLAPALPMPVVPVNPVDVVAELPPCQTGTDGAAQLPASPETPAGGEPPPTEGPADAEAGHEEAVPVDCEVVPVADAADAHDGMPSLDYTRMPRGRPAPVKWGRPLGRPKPWFAGVSTQEGMVLGDRNLTYRSVEGPSVSVGSLTPFSPGWASTAPIGGVQLTNLSAASDSTVPEGKLGYSSVWGRINNTDPALTAGGLETGPPAGTSSLRYGLTPDLTLEGQVQSARALSATGLGTTYSLGQWGTLQGGATQSHFDTAQGWRYRLGYNVDLFDMMTLGYANELTSSGYGDLSTYADGATATRQWRNTFSAGVPISGWGIVSGTYSGLRDTAGELLESRYGVSQSMLLSPNVRLAVGADHDVISGDYALNMQLTMPIGGR